MDLINKKFKNLITGKIFEIIDVYNNIAITNEREKINTNLLMDKSLFLNIQNSSTIKENISTKSLIKEDVIDPEKFFNNPNTHNVFANQIKSIPLDKIPESDVSEGYSPAQPIQSIQVPDSNFNYPVSSESAIVVSSVDDEIEELKSKYGATYDEGSVAKQNEIFSKILEEKDDNKNIEVINASRPSEYSIENSNNYIQKVESTRQVDPVMSMFKSVKRNLDFNINLNISGKIPRIDFIEMMEDSYEYSIIEYLADEFTNNLLIDPSAIRNKIIDEIKSMIAKNQIVPVDNNSTPSAKKETPKKPSIKKYTTKKAASEEIKKV